jgi:hypothetical protein
VLGSRGGRHRESDRLEGREAPLETEPEARRGLEVLALEAPSFQDQIATCLEDIPRDGVPAASAIDTDANDPETAKALADARGVDPPSGDPPCPAGARFDESRRPERTDMRGQGRHGETGSATGRGTWTVSVSGTGIARETKGPGFETGSATPKGGTRGMCWLMKLCHKPNQLKASTDGLALLSPEIAAAREAPHPARRRLLLQGVPLTGHAPGRLTDEMTGFSRSSDSHHRGTLDQQPSFHRDRLQSERIPSRNPSLQRLAHPLH